MEVDNLKRIICLLAATFIMSSISYADFSDIDEKHWAYDAVTQMEKTQILTGYPDGSFKPSNNINLGEYASIFSNFFNINANIDSNCFVDISESHWAKGRVEAIREYIQPQYNSILEYAEGKNNSYELGVTANMPVTREIVFYSLNSILAFDESVYSEGEEKRLFADYDKIVYPKAAVVLYKNEIVSGEIIDGKVYINPTKYITRAEISSLFYKLLNNGEKITNEEKIETFETIINDFGTLIEACKLNEAKMYIYDSANMISNIDFDSVIDKKLKSMINKYFSKLEYKVIDYGFTSYNKAYITISKTGYDYSNILKPLKSISTKSISEIAKEVTKTFDNEKLNVNDTIETINFIKNNNEWKIVL